MRAAQRQLCERIRRHLPLNRTAEDIDRFLSYCRKFMFIRHGGPRPRRCADEGIHDVINNFGGSQSLLITVTVQLTSTRLVVWKIAYSLWMMQATTAELLFVFCCLNLLYLRWNYTFHGRRHGVDWGGHVHPLLPESVPEICRSAEFRWSLCVGMKKGR